MSQRERKSIVAQGINTSLPCNIVEDGQCEDVFNMRYKNGALQSLYHPTIIAPITNNGGMTIISKPSFLPADRYVALSTPIWLQPAGKPTGYYTYLMEVAVNDGEVVNIITIHTFHDAVYPANINVFDFGNVLYVNWKKLEKVFVYKEGTYTDFNLGQITPPAYYIDNHDRKDVPKNGERPNSLEAIPGTLLLKCHMVRNAGGDFYIRVKEFGYNNGISDINSQGYVNGGFYIMLAYKMFDGSIIKPSMISYVSSAHIPKGINADYDKGKTLMRFHYQEASESYEEYYYDVISGVKPIINIHVPTDINQDLIKSVLVFATRNIPEYDYENTHEKYPLTADKVDYTPTIPLPNVSLWLYSAYRNSILNDNVLKCTEPFYEIADIPLYQTLLGLNYNDHFKDIESKPLYKASLSNHHTTAAHKFEFNSRSHNYDLITRIFNGHSVTPLISLTGSQGTGLLPTEIDPGAEYVRDITITMTTYLTIDNKQTTVTTTFNGGTLQLQGDTKEYIAIHNMLNYPDARAEKMRITASAGGIYVDQTFELTKDLVHNCAYCFVDKSKDNYRIREFALLALHIGHVEMPVMSEIFIEQRNKLQVSQLNNPFYVEPEHIYTIGNIDNVIEGLECAADQVTESKFGLYPLFVFSSKGIYALESGTGEVLYQSVIAINNEKKLPGTTTVSARNYVFYVGVQGVMIIEGKTVQLISGALDKYPALSKYDTSVVPFEQYKQGVTLMYNAHEMEIIAYSRQYDYAYIFSLEAKQWSRRNWDCIPLSVGLLSSPNGIKSALEEDLMQPVNPCRIISRAIKLGSLDFKKLETLAARLQCDNGAVYSLFLDGSNDLSQWSTLYRVDNSNLMRRTTASYKYYRIRLDVSASQYIALTNFDIEYYLRFVNKLR